MTVGSTLLTVVLAAIGVAAFATSPLILAATIGVGLVTLAVVAHRWGRTLNRAFPPPTPELLLGRPEVPEIPAPMPAGELTDERELIALRTDARTGVDGSTFS